MTWPGKGHREALLLWKNGPPGADCYVLVCLLSSLSLLGLLGLLGSLGYWVCWANENKRSTRKIKYDPVISYI